MSIPIHTAAILLSVASLIAADGAAQPPHAKLGPAKVTISRATTYVTGPLRSDGWVDYAAIVNERDKQGVTKDNNAAVLFWQAVGPQRIFPKSRAAFFRQLELDAPPDNGDYLTSIYEYLPRRKDHPATGTAEYAAWEQLIDKQSDVAKSRPWTAAEFPALAGWLKANRVPLELISACAKRPKFYEPLIVDASDSLWNADVAPELSGMRTAVDLLRIRAMQRVAEGKTDDAWNDLLTCHRLARLSAEGPLLVNLLVVFWAEQSASDGDAAFVQHAALTHAELLRCRRDLANLVHVLPLRAAVSNERLWNLDFLRWLAGGDAQARDMCGGFLTNDDLKETRNKLLADKRVDWDVIFRACNADFDEAEKIWQLPGGLRQRNELKGRERLASDAAKRVNDPVALAKLLAPQTSSAEISRRLADVLLGSSGIGDFSGLASARMMVTAKSQLTDFAIALALFHRDHRSYPQTLTELAPRHIAAVPKDPLSDREYIYLQKDGGYLLYSVGRNGRDDHGANYWADHLTQFDGETDPDKLPDDLCIRSPKAAAKN